MYYLRCELPDHSIWTISHAGHEIPDNSASSLQLPDLKGNPDLYSLEANIQHKIDFIKKYVDASKTEVTLVGHSVGCKIVLDIMKSEVLDFKMGCMLFPMIERMYETPAGKRTWRLVHYFPQLVTILAWILSLIPQSFMRPFLSSWMNYASKKPCEIGDKMSKPNIEAVVKLIDANVVRHIFHLAQTEFPNVREADYETIVKYSEKLKFYYGCDDDWAPRQYYDELVAKVPNLHAEYGSSDNVIPHAFVLWSSKPIAKKVANWILHPEENFEMRKTQ